MVVNLNSLEADLQALFTPMQRQSTSISETPYAKLEAFRPGTQAFSFSYRTHDSAKLSGFVNERTIFCMACAGCHRA